MRLKNELLQWSWIVLLIAVLMSCKKEEATTISEVKPSVLLKIDLENSDNFVSSNTLYYLAAYTPDGELLGYGSLSDSLKWELSGNYTGATIDVLMFEVWDNSNIEVLHYTDVPIGQSFTQQNSLASASSEKIQQWNINPKNGQLQQMTPTIPKQRYGNIMLTLKIEDFGNRPGNSTGTSDFESNAYFYKRGDNCELCGKIQWDKIEGGFTFLQKSFNTDSLYQGFVINMVERGSNDAYCLYFNQPLTNANNGDTLTINKSDFTKGLVKTIDLTSSSNNLASMNLHTYCHQNGYPDLLLSFEEAWPTRDTRELRYFTADNLPLNSWHLIYNQSSFFTDYSLTSNQQIPSSIEIKEITGESISKVGEQYKLTHGQINTTSIITRSCVNLYKINGNNTAFYSLYFDGSKSIGTSTFKLFEIPPFILDKYNNLVPFKSGSDWLGNSYSQTYANITGYGPIDDLKNKLGIDNEDPAGKSNAYKIETYIQPFLR